MILRLAARSIAERPVRSAVLAAGFGVGIGVMASLLGIGDVILEQARSPDLVGGGDVIVTGAAGRVESARFVLRTLLHGAESTEVRAVSPLAEAPLYLVDDLGATIVQATGGIPELERAIGDPETAAVAEWRGAQGDEAWIDPSAEAVLRAMDRFHPIPDVPEYADSWAEWLYFNGRAGAARFYLSFLVGPRNERGGRDAVVRIQLDRGGTLVSYSERTEVAEVDLAAAPDLEVGSSSVRLEGLDYRIRLDLPSEVPRTPGIAGEISLHAEDGASMPPLALRGADGWISGYTVPVLFGALSGKLAIGGETLELDGGRGYHDHNWGFWEGVSWQWGQVEGDDLSLVYGRVRPPAEVADPERVPAVLAAVGPDGPLGFAASTTIRETDDAAGEPRTIAIRARGGALDLDVIFDVEQIEASAMSGPGDLRFLQMRGRYRVSGRVSGREVAFERAGSAETFRPAPREGTAEGLDGSGLDHAIGELAARAEPGRLGVGVMDLASGETWFRNADERFPMQSMFKAPLAAAVLSAVDAGRLSLDDTVTIGERDLSPPYSDLSADWPERTTYTVAELLERAAGRSDNTAADVLTERLGGPAAVTAWLRSKGIDGLRIDRLERQLQVEIAALGAFRPEWRTEPAYVTALAAVPEEMRRRAMQAHLADPQDTTTPRAAVAFLSKLQRGELLSPASTERLLQIMTETRTGRNRLKAGLPARSRLAHKTGTGRPDLGIAPAVNDMGIATLPDGRRVIVVAMLCGSTLDEAAREAILAETARAAVAAPR